MTDPHDMPNVLLVGTNLTLLEGIAQSLSAQANVARVAATFADARDLATSEQPLLAIVERSMAAESASEVLGLRLASGGALVLYRDGAGPGIAIPHALQRHVLAELTLPLERNRLMALLQSVRDRAAAAGRGRISGETERDLGR